MKVTVYCRTRQGYSGSTNSYARVCTQSTNEGTERSRRRRNIQTVGGGVIDVVGVGDGDGDGDGDVNDEPELMVFDEVSVQELPQSCCISWLFPLLEKSLVNL